MMHFPLPLLPSSLRLWLLQMSAMGTDKRTDGRVGARHEAAPCTFTTSIQLIWNSPCRAPVSLCR